MIAKIKWLIDRKKDIINTINSLTNRDNNTARKTKAFTGKHSDISWEDISKELDCFYTESHPEYVFIKHYNNSGTPMTNMPNYAYPGVSVSLSSNGAGIFTGTINLPSNLYSLSTNVFVMGGHNSDGNYNDAIHAGFRYTSGNLKNIEIILANDNNRNRGFFTLMISITR